MSFSDVVTLSDC